MTGHLEPPHHPPTVDIVCSVDMEIVLAQEDDKYMYIEHREGSAKLTRDG